jgi:transcriptional regulator with GAF, ATPase, and Fis domain
MALVAAAAADSGETVSQSICDALATPAVVLVRVWVVESEQRLRLLSSAGQPTGGGSYRRIDGTFRRVETGSGKIGQTASQRQPFIVREVRGDESWLTNPDWAARQGVRSFAAYPLIARGTILGVMALFSRLALSDGVLGDLQLLADVAAARLRSMQATAPVVLTRARMRDLERRSIQEALARTNGRVFGANGAAALLDIKPTTLASRIKALGIKQGGAT